MAPTPDGSTTYRYSTELRYALPQNAGTTARVAFLPRNEDTALPSSDSTPYLEKDVLSAVDLYDKQYFAAQPKSLSGIATRSFLLGSAFTVSVNVSLYLLLITDSTFWRLSFFFGSLSLFHFLEFWTTARYNTRAAQISSFLLSQNGYAYNIAHTTAFVEFIIANWFFPDKNWLSPSINTTLLGIGLCLILMGQGVRTLAMIEAGTSFNHIVQHSKKTEHTLVTTGVYRILRHPSYFGFFWWGLGTQLVLGNVICFVAYTIVLWRFFSRRIEGEEELLIKFFGNEYAEFMRKTSVGIPFIK